MKNSWKSQLASFLNRFVSPTDRLLIATSGGADSAVLLAMLNEVDGITSDRLVAGYVNHGLRDDYLSDITTVGQLGSRFHTQVIIKNVDTLCLKKESGLSIEASARKLRYRALSEMAEENGCHWILTGHTMDDSAETVLMRIRNGSPWYECTGIPERRGIILRPLLTFRRKELRDWGEKRDIPYYDDKTNLDPRFIRNRLRQKLRAAPEFWTDDRVQRLNRAGQDLNLAIDAYRKAACLYVTTCGIKPNPQIIGLAINEILRYFDSLIFVPVEVAWGRLTGQIERRLPSARRRQTVDCLNGKTSAARFELSAEIALERRNNLIWLSRTQIRPIRARMELGITRIPERNITIRLEKREASDLRPRGILVLSARILEGSLIVRSWQPGDRLKTRGRPTKKIADLLAEQKTDPATRASSLVLADDNGPLLLIGGPIAERAQPLDFEQGVIWFSWTLQ